MPTELDFSTTNFRGPTPTRFSRKILNKAVLDILGTSTAPPVGITLAIPSMLNIQGRTYSSLSPDNQYKWLLTEYIPRAITPYFDIGIGVPEFHKSGCIHLHMICIRRSAINTEYHERTLQSDVNNAAVTYSIHKGKRSNAVHQTFVHFIKDLPEWIMYIQKDQFKFEGSNIQPYYWHDNSKEFNLEPIQDLAMVSSQTKSRDRKIIKPLTSEQSLFRQAKRVGGFIILI